MTNTVNITKLNHAGEVVFTYPGVLQFADQELVIVRCRWDRLPPVTVGELAFQTGDILLEYFYRRHWFNIFSLYDGLGNLKGWYCNVSEALTITENTVRWRDLALDLVVLPDGRQEVRDEAEFEALAPADDLRARAYTALDTLRSWARSGHPPFVVAAIERWGQL